MHMTSNALASDPTMSSSFVGIAPKGLKVPNFYAGDLAPMQAKAREYQSRGVTSARASRDALHALRKEGLWGSPTAFTADGMKTRSAQLTKVRRIATKNGKSNAGYGLSHISPTVSATSTTKFVTVAQLCALADKSSKKGQRLLNFDVSGPASIDRVPIDASDIKLQAVNPFDVITVSRNTKTQSGVPVQEQRQSIRSAIVSGHQAIQKLIRYIQQGENRGEIEQKYLGILLPIVIPNSETASLQKATHMVVNPYSSTGQKHREEGAAVAPRVYPLGKDQVKVEKDGSRRVTGFKFQPMISRETMHYLEQQHSAKLEKKGQGKIEERRTKRQKETAPGYPTVPGLPLPNRAVPIGGTACLRAVRGEIASLPKGALGPLTKLVVELLGAEGLVAKKMATVLKRCYTVFLSTLRHARARGAIAAAAMYNAHGLSGAGGLEGLKATERGFSFSADKEDLKTIAQRGGHSYEYDQENPEKWDSVDPISGASDQVSGRRLQPLIKNMYDPTRKAFVPWVTTVAQADRGYHQRPGVSQHRIRGSAGPINDAIRGLYTEQTKRRLENNKGRYLFPEENDL